MLKRQILLLRRPRQEDHEFAGSPGNIASSHLKIITTKNNNTHSFQTETFIGCIVEARRADSFIIIIKAKLLQGRTESRPCTYRQDNCLIPHCCVTKPAQITFTISARREEDRRDASDKRLRWKPHLSRRRQSPTRLFRKCGYDAH